MSALIPRRGPPPRTAARQAPSRPRRLAAALAALTCALLASAALVPAAWAVNVIPPGGGDPAATVSVISGGMAGWQITLIALGAALVAATAACSSTGRSPPAGPPRQPPRDAHHPARRTPAVPGPWPGSRHGPGRAGRTPTAGASGLPSRGQAKTADPAHHNRIVITGRLPGRSEPGS
jgi:hypothetical protein